ncbi:MAG: thioredoxin family protein [Sulfurimonas sp.]
MKYFFIMWLLWNVSLSAETIRWNSNYEAAHKEALKENKMLMVLLIESNSKECNKILTTTFKEQEYIKRINELFVSVLITKGQKESYPIEMLYTMSYPSIFFLNTQELFVGNNIYGYISPEAFKMHLKLYE